MPLPTCYPFVKEAIATNPIDESLQNPLPESPAQSPVSQKGRSTRRGKREKIVPNKHTWQQELLSWVLTLVLPVLILLFLNQFVGKLVVVRGTSMYPTLYDSDLLIVQTINYTPQQGDIVICSVSGTSSLSGKNIVKRVIAVGGQTVTIDYDNNTVTVDDVVLEEDYLNTSYGDVMIARSDTVVTYQVPEGYIFVMGDNRNNSSDSRSEAVGMISLDQVIGGSILDIPIGHLIGENDNP